jgi:hypothetical protein
VQARFGYVPGRDPAEEMVIATFREDELRKLGKPEWCLVVAVVSEAPVFERGCFFYSQLAYSDFQWRGTKDIITFASALDFLG